MCAKKFGNSIYQTHVSRFSVRNWTFKTADEFSPSHLFRVTISTVLLDPPVPRPGSFLWHGVAVSNEFLHYSISSHLPYFWGHKRLINGILWNKCLLLCINLGRKALPPSAILEACAFSWFESSGLNFQWKQMSRLTSKCWFVNKHLERMFS